MFSELLGKGNSETVNRELLIREREGERSREGGNVTQGLKVRRLFRACLIIHVKEVEGTTLTGKLGLENESKYQLEGFGPDVGNADSYCFWRN